MKKNPALWGLKIRGSESERRISQECLNEDLQALTGALRNELPGWDYFCAEKICEKLSHKISIVSEPGKGTLVLLDLRMMDLRF